MCAAHHPLPLAALSGLPLFAGMDSAAITRVLAVARRHSFRAGAFLFQEGEPGAGYVVLLDGMVRLYRANPEGRLHTLSLLRAPAAFNEVAAIDGGCNPVNALAVTDVDAAIITHSALLQLMAGERALMGNALRVLARLNRDTLERLEDMTFRTIPSRLAKLFLHDSAYSGQICETPSRLTQEEMAAILGSTREVVGRALRALLNAGLLTKHGRYFAIADRDGLAHLAENNVLEVNLTCVKK